MTITEASISLNDLKFYAYHGVLPQENTVGAYYTINLKIDYSPSSSALVNDELSGTINYAEIYDTVKIIMTKPKKLLEAVAHEIIKQLMSKYPTIHKIHVSVAKDNPPISSDSKGISIELTGTR